jgi:hypothetical protein
MDHPSSAKDDGQSLSHVPHLGVEFFRAELAVR